MNPAGLIQRVAISSEMIYHFQDAVNRAKEAKNLAKTLFDKLWEAHEVASDGDGASLIAIDRVMLHERTGSVALQALADEGRAVRDPSRVFAVMDHIVSFREGRGRNDARLPGGETFIVETRKMAEAAGLHLIDTDDARQGIVHVVAPELGIVQPGLSIICPDSHTCTLGAFGALAVGIGSSDAEHAMATGVMRMSKPAQMRVEINGALKPGVTAKDLALHIISHYGVAGGKRCAIEYTGSAVDVLDIEARLTLCNLAVEFAAYTALIAPDDKVFDYVKGRAFAPKEAHWRDASTYWRSFYSDDGAHFDHHIEIDASTVTPMISWGISPEQTVSIDGEVPKLTEMVSEKRLQAEQAYAYMGLAPGKRIEDLVIDGVFIGSCTNGRLSDLRAAAAVLKGKKIAPNLRAVCVPGSKAVRRAAEQEGLDRIFKAAGFEWGESGCAMCFYAGGETFAPGARIVSSTNRNFEGRQGPGVRTHLASPETVAASAIAGKITSAASIPEKERLAI